MSVKPRKYSMFSREFRNLTDKLSSALAGPLPGPQIRERMLARVRLPVVLPNAPETATAAAVLILLHRVDGEICFYLTERTDTVENHKGQVSLPGGAREADEELADTARRETREEIGVPEPAVNIIGELTPLYVPFTGFMIHPFVGWIDPPPATRADPREVRTLFGATLRDLLDDRREKSEVREIRGYTVDVPYYSLNGHKVWGATAMILTEFKQLLKDLGDW
ncbi:MAG: CoA pyrophosphatase [Candidatus Neomarinimicrobiota bacterium]